MYKYSRPLYLLINIVGVLLLMIDTKLHWEILLSSTLISTTWMVNYVNPTNLPRAYLKSHLKQRYGPAIFKAIVKIFIVSAIGFAVAHSEYGFSFHQVSHDIQKIQLFDISIFHVAIWSGLLAYFGLWTSLSSCLQVACFALPLTLSTPLSFAWQVFQCHLPGSINDACAVDMTDFSPLLLVAALFLWTGQVFNVAQMWTFIPPSKACSLEKDLWHSPEVNMVFLEQSVAMN